MNILPLIIVISTLPTAHPLAAEMGKPVSSEISSGLALMQSLVFQEKRLLGPISEYWVSEKLDGVRAVWDGQYLRFKSGRIIQAPAWFTAAFPARRLDGELWIGRQQFEQVSGIVRQQIPDETAWQTVSFQAFDLPDDPGSFTQRLNHLQHLVQTSAIPWLQVIPQHRFTDHKALQEHLKALEREGGEGLMLHHAQALRTIGRSPSLLKFKSDQDAEARVIAHEPGRGRLAGVLGALRVKLPNGQTLRIGSGFSDEHRRNPPPIGSMVTYRHRGFTRTGLPRFATYWRQREDE